MVWNREEYIAHMTGQYTGREMFCELFGPLVGLEDEWRIQGASDEEVSLSAFGWDYVKKTNIAVSTRPVTGMEEVIVKDDDEERITRDSMGRTMRLCKKSATIPLPQSYPVQTMDDWVKIKHWYKFTEDRIDKNALQLNKRMRDGGYLSLAFMKGAFDEPRQLMGEENLCYAFYEEPELIKDMLRTMADLQVKVFERAVEICPIDCLCVHEDMAGKSGPLVGPNLIEEFFKPYYLKIWEVAESSGCKLFSQDSDGNMNPVIDSFIDCGVNIFYPCEPGSGMDIVQLRKKYGKKIAFKGGIDKYALLKGKDEIKKELEYKICDITKGGGVCFALDHRIPNGVSIENYRYYVSTGRALLGLPDAEYCKHSHMAF